MPSSALSSSIARKRGLCPKKITTSNSKNCCSNWFSFTIPTRPRLIPESHDRTVCTLHDFAHAGYQRVFLFRLQEPRAGREVHLSSAKNSCGQGILPARHLRLFARRLGPFGAEHDEPLCLGHPVAL